MVLGSLYFFSVGGWECRPVAGFTFHNTKYKLDTITSGIKKLFPF